MSTLTLSSQTVALFKLKIGVRLCLTVILLGFVSAPLSASTIIADLSRKDVAITTDFHGTELLLFGAVKGEEEDDIVVVFSGPQTKIASRKKEKVNGIWVNTETVLWQNAPSFYQLLSTRPKDDILSPALQAEYRIGQDYIPLQTKVPIISQSDYAEWFESLNRNMSQLGLWETRVGDVELIRGALFRAPVLMPANIIPGRYEVRVLHISKGTVRSEYSTTVRVTKQGIGAFIFSIAHRYSVFYGLFAVAFAVFAGWLAAMAFRRS